MKKIIFLIVAFSSLSTFAQLRVAKIFGDHMVLQRLKQIPVWGWASKGEKIIVNFNNFSVSATTGNDGKWAVKLPSMEAGGPFVLKVTGKKNEIEIKDILIGEVWICSGQSNMEWRVSSSDNAAIEIRNANNPQIRQFKVATDLSLQPESDLKNKADWKIASPQTVGDFTAAGYFLQESWQIN